MVTSDRWSEPVLPKRPRRRSAPNFYRDSLSETEQIQLKDAQKVENLGDEIAVFRVRLKKALKDRPEDFRLLERGIGILVRAVSAQYRLSPKARHDLADSLAAVFNSLGDHILPPDHG
jgi:hypothetical protein